MSKCRLIQSRRILLFSAKKHDMTDLWNVAGCISQVCPQREDSGLSYAYGQNHANFTQFILTIPPTTTPTIYIYSMIPRSTVYETEDMMSLLNSALVNTSCWEIEGYGWTILVS